MSDEIAPGWAGAVSEDDAEKFINSKRVVGLTRQAAGTYLRGPHRVSDLVLRVYEGKLQLAAFIYFYTNEEAAQYRLPRPSEWVVLDFISGEPIKKIKCTDEEFSDASYDMLYSVPIEDEYDLSPEYYRETYSILDDVRMGVMEGKRLDKRKYTLYLKAIMKNTPHEYRRFFTDLSNLGNVE